MEERQIMKPHNITFSNRKIGSITGVKDVISFNLTSILVETDYGMLSIKGHDLHVGKLSVEKGELEIDGTIDGILYTDVNTYAKKGESLFARLFK